MVGGCLDKRVRPCYTTPMRKRQYIYFVSYQHVTGPQHGFGSCEVSSPVKVTTIDMVFDISKELCAKLGYDTVIVLNYSILRRGIL